MNVQGLHNANQKLGEQALSDILQGDIVGVFIRALDHKRSELMTQIHCYLVLVIHSVVLKVVLTNGNNYS